MEEEKGYIELRIKKNKGDISPKDVDISEVKEFISDIENFLFPDRESKHTRPKISYEIKEGSVVHRFYMPISDVILFNGLTQEIDKRKSLDFLNYKRQTIIDKFQKKATKKNYIIELNNSIENKPSLIISNTTHFEKTLPAFYESEFYLYGEIYQEGGKKPNIHISTKEYGNLVVSATKDQIIEGEKKTYKLYGIKVRGKINPEDNTLSDLQLIEFLKYTPEYNESLITKAIRKASVNLSKIKNVDAWLNNIKAEGI